MEAWKLHPAGIGRFVRDIVIRSLVIAGVVLGLDFIPNALVTLSSGAWSSISQSILNVLPPVMVGVPKSNVHSFFDALQTGLSQISSSLTSLAKYEPNQESRRGLVTTLLQLFGVAPAIVIALTSFAVTGLAAYGNPSFVLLYRWRSRRPWERVLGVLSGRSNPLHRSLVLSVSLVGGLLLLAGSFDVGVTRNHVGPLAAAVILAGLLVLNFLWLLVWILTLRRPSDTIVEILSMGKDVLAYVHDPLRIAGRLHKSTRQFRFPTFPFDYEDDKWCICWDEQEEIRRCLQGLTEFVLRALEQRQRTAALEATRAIAVLCDWASATKFPSDWKFLRRVEHGDSCELPDWLLEEFVHSFESIVAECADLHYYSVAIEAIRKLREIGYQLITDAQGKWPGRDRVLRRTLDALMNGFILCVLSEDLEIRDPVLEAMRHIFSERPTGKEVMGADSNFLRNNVTGLGVWAVQKDDIGSVRSILKQIMECERLVERDLDELMMAVLSLGTIALGVRKYACATALVDYACDNKQRGESLMKAMTRLLVKPSPQMKYLPLYVDWDYGVIFCVLVVTRALVWGRDWSLAQAAEVNKFVVERRMENKNPSNWAKVTILRMGNAASYPPEDIKPWADFVDRFVPPPKGTSVTGQIL